MAEEFPTRPAEGGVLPVIQEELQIERRQRQTGAVRVRKVVHEENVDVPGQLFTERVTTERVPVGRVVQLRPLVREEGDTVVIPVVEERLVVHTELVLVEEVRITKHREVRDGSQAVGVRHEEALVERLDPATGCWERET